jgi:hypothetical protein
MDVSYQNVNLKFTFTVRIALGLVAAPNWGLVIKVCQDPNTTWFSGLFAFMVAARLKRSFSLNDRASWALIEN